MDTGRKIQDAFSYMAYKEREKSRKVNSLGRHMRWKYSFNEIVNS